MGYRDLCRRTAHPSGSHGCLTLGKMNAPVQPFPGRVIHGLSLGDWYPCWNLSLSGRLWSPDLLAQCDPGIAASHVSLRDVPIDQLRIVGTPQGVPTPRATWYVWAAAWIRRGGHVGIGMDRPKWTTPDEASRLLRIGDMELEFERVRRSVAPTAASRLASLYVAEDSEIGRAHVRQMLGADVMILQVSIPLAIRVTRVDTAWFDLYAAEGKEEHIIHYWSGHPLDESCPTWEYLVEGAVEAVDPEELEFVRARGAHKEPTKTPSQRRE